MSFSVGELAKATNVSVRTLHHYDEIGLLRPSERTRAGYRRYSAADAARLHTILVYRELGFSLERIAEILDDPQADVRAQLEQQKQLLGAEVARLQQLIRSVEAMMEASKQNYKLTSDEMKEVFGSFDPARHEAEAEQRWGNTDAYRESARRTKQYGKQQWLEIKEEAAAINAAFISAMRAGVAATDARALDIAERHRQHITRWFYPCSPQMHRGLGEMYVADPRFTASYEEQAAGLAQYVHDAVVANAERVAG